MMMEHFCDKFSYVSRDLDNSFEFIVVKRTTQGYGFELLKDDIISSSQNNNRDAFVVKMKEINIEDTKQGLMTGDEILSFNGISIRQLTRSHIEDTLENGRNDIELIIRRSPPNDLPEIEPDEGYCGYDNLGFDMPQEVDFIPRTKEHHISNSELDSMNGEIHSTHNGMHGPRQWTITL